MVSKKIVILVTAVVVTITMLIGSNYIVYSAEKGESAMGGGKGSDSQMTQDYNQMTKDHSQMMQDYRQMMQDHKQMMQNCRQMMKKRSMMKKKNQTSDEQTVDKEGDVKHDHSKHQ